MHESPSSEDGNDLIFVQSLNLKATTGVDSWGRKRPQPILLTLWLKNSIALAGSTDHLPYSINYGTVTKVITAHVENGTFNSLEHLAEYVARAALGPDINAGWVKVIVEKPRALLRADAAGIAITRRKNSEGEVLAEGSDRVFVKDLRLVTIIGVNPWEREEKQAVVINLTMHKENSPGKPVEVAEGGKFDPHYNFRSVVKRVTEHVEASDYKTVEAFVTAVAKEACIGCGISKITVRAEKPSALTFAEGPGVEITRERSFFALEEAAAGVEGKHEVYIALGSNIGDRFRAIKDAVAEVEKRGIKVKRTSSLYQSAPMYYLDQPTFLNGVMQVETTLSPDDLLGALKEVEFHLGREKTIENGPRSIDLDILLYDNLVLETPHLTIPHAKMLEREFVLRPLCDISPNKPHPLTSTAFKHHLNAIPPPPPSTPRLRTFASLSPHLPPLDPSNPQRRTYIMAILNLTPDSFSDGGQLTQDNIVQTAHELITAGADILDMGGCSTRPGSEQVTPEEEMQRVIPAIKALREAGIKNAISIDTYRAIVAKAVISAGADIINDVSAGTLDPAMLPTAAELAVPICLMHMRGTPSNMSSLTSYPAGLLPTILSELQERVRAAEDAGVRRWNILLDPGLGFAKDLPQNLEVLRGLREITNGIDLPWVLGPSRKGFVGEVTGVQVARERTWGTAAAVAACVAGGADVVRVHDVKEMKMVVDMAGGIWRK
ncbi:Dihydropteroate synthase [Choiromyces venosus 120613-1]|uniref:Folic acid synthesis protein FOL1 n=1 Tax=Choiromyces venosus 120613-1 TaxID=1336337 RepID=A0A3N4J8V5_9PEZI|nr:Dihydropteroate synthase [Choiromyces venosus 120613-1]